MSATNQSATTEERKDEIGAAATLSAGNATAAGATTSTSTTTDTNSTAEPEATSGGEKATTAAADAPEPVVELIHPRHACDGCGQKPIVGLRYHCADGCDYDLCQTCKLKLPHPTTETHTSEHALSEGLEGQPREPKDNRTPWMIILDNTMNIMKWLIPIASDEAVAELVSLLEEFEDGRALLTKLSAEGATWGPVSSINWTEKVSFVLTKYFRGGYGKCVQMLSAAERHPVVTELAMAYFKFTKTYLETFDDLVKRATVRLNEQQQVVDADRAKVAAAKEAGINYEDEYDPAEADKKASVYCAIQYELFGYFRAYYLIIQVIHRGDYGLCFALLNNSLGFWLKYCICIMRAKDRYCLCTRQICSHIISLLLRPENTEAVQFLFSGEDETMALIHIIIETIHVLSAHDGVLGGPERPGLCDVIREGSSSGGPLTPDPDFQSTNGAIGLKLMRTLLALKRVFPGKQASYSPIVTVIALFCSSVFKDIGDEVSPQDQISIERQVSGWDPENQNTGRLDLLGALTMQGAILGGFDWGYYQEDPTQMTPVFFHLLRFVENPKLDHRIRGLAVDVIAQAIAALPDETTPLLYEQYQELYPSDSSIPAEKRLPVIHRLLTVLEELIIADPIEKFYPPFEEFRQRLIWAIIPCAKVIPMKEFSRNAPRASVSISTSDEQKDNAAADAVSDPTSDKTNSVVTGPAWDAKTGELRNVFVWLMDLLELFMRNDPRIRSDGLPSPLTPEAVGDVWEDRWQLHRTDVELVKGLLDVIRSRNYVTSYHWLNTTDMTALNHWAPFVPRLYPLLLTLLELLSPTKGSNRLLLFPGLTLIGNLIRFIPKAMLLEKNNWSRLQLISDRILGTPIVIASKAEEEAMVALKDSIHIGRQQIYDRCQAQGRWIPYELEIELEKHQQLKEHQSRLALPILIELRRMHAESVHDMRASLMKVHGALLDVLWSEYDSSLRAKLLDHLFRVLPSNYGTLPKTEEDALRAKAEREEKAKVKAAAKMEAKEARKRARVEARAAAAAAGEDGEEQSEEDDVDDAPDEDDAEEKDDEASNIHSSPCVDKERSAAIHVLSFGIFGQALFTSPNAHVDELYDMAWSLIKANQSAYGPRTMGSLVDMTSCLPLLKPMALDKKWRPGEISVLPPTLQHQLTENIDLGIAVFKTSTDIDVIERIFIGWGELLKGYGLAALGNGSDISSETINRREAELITYAMFIIRFEHPCEHGPDVTNPARYDAASWQRRMAEIDADEEEGQREQGVAAWRSTIEKAFHTKVHTHGAACTDAGCYYDELVTLGHRCCEFLAHLARARGSSFETRHKRLWKHLSFSAEKITWRGALGCYWTGVAESLGSEGFDTYKVDVFEYMLTNLTIKESHGLFLGQSAVCLGNIFMHIDLPRIQSYLTRTLDGLLRASAYAQNKLDLHKKAMDSGTRDGLCTNFEFVSWNNCHDGVTIALGKILMVASSLPDVTSRLDELLRVFLSGLPLKDLMDDQKVVYSAVIKLINTFPQQHPGKIEPHYPRILEIFATVLDLNLGKHRILPQLEKFILMGAKSILKQQPQLRQTVLMDEWKEKDAGHFGQRFCERIEGKPISSNTTTS